MVSPVQAPHPPVWLMSNAPPTFKHAGANDLNVVSMAALFGRIRACWKPFRDARIGTGERDALLGQSLLKSSEDKIACVLTGPITT